MIKKIIKSKILLCIVDIFFFLETLFLGFGTGMDMGGFSDREATLNFYIMGLVFFVQLFMIIVQIKWFSKETLRVLSILNVILIVILVNYNVIDSYYDPLLLYSLLIITSLFFVIRCYALGEING